MVRRQKRYTTENTVRVEAARPRRKYSIQSSVPFKAPNTVGRELVYIFVISKIFKNFMLIEILNNKRLWPIYLRFSTQSDQQ